MTKKILAELAAILAVADDDSYDHIDRKWRKIWHNADGQFHRDGDLPAVIWADGSVYYFKNGKFHRDDNLPAIIRADGYVSYYIDGRLIQQFDK